jgi:hypothetical protein
MCQLIDQLACDKGINVNDANCIYAFVADYLVTKMPQLKKVIEDIFENADHEQLQEDIGQAVLLIQREQWKEKFKDILMPTQGQVIHASGKGELF